MMKTMLVVLAMMQAASAQPAADSVSALSNRLSAAKTLETKGDQAAALAEYLFIVNSAPPPKAGDQSSTSPYDSIVSEAALHAATMLEPSCPGGDTKAVSGTIELYKKAQRAPESAQRALAANNMAVFLWRCKATNPDPRDVMAGIPFDGLNEKLRSSYLDNYALLDEHYAQLEHVKPDEAAKSWHDAADQYRKALSSTPTDQTALDGIWRLLDKLPDRLSFASSVADLLAREQQARSALKIVLRVIDLTPEVSSQECAAPLASLLRAFAAAGISGEEFGRSYAPQLDKMAARQKMAVQFVTELRRVYEERVNVIGPSSGPFPADPPSQSVCRFPAAIVPVVPRLDRALTAPFQSSEARSLRRFFPQFFALGETQSLSRLLEFVADECARQVKPDLECAGEKFADAWLLDPSNTSAAVGLALLSKAEPPDQNSTDFLTKTVAPFYAASGQGVKALYSEPSQRTMLQLDPAQKQDVNRVNALLGRRELSPVSETEKDEFRLRVPHDGDRIVTGTAPRKWEAIRIQTMRATREGGCPKTPGQKYITAATNAVTGAFSADLDTSLHKGEALCIYGVEGGEVKNVAAPFQAAAIPIFRRAHTYISGGIFWSRVAGQQHLLPRAAFDKDFNLARWGYDRYHERADRAYPAVTALVNVFAEWRVTAIAQGLASQTGSNAVTNVQSLEFGGYVPLFTHRATWTFLGERRAFFVAPLVKGGVDFFPSLGSQSAFSSGARVGILRLLGATGFMPPELQSYVDVVYGNSRNVVVSPPNGPSSQTNSVTRLQQLDVTGMVKVPETPFYLGFNATAGPGAKQTAVFAGLRVNLRRLLRGSPL